MLAIPEDLVRLAIAEPWHRGDAKPDLGKLLVERPRGWSLAHTLQALAEGHDDSVGQGLTRPPRELAREAAGLIVIVIVIVIVIDAERHATNLDVSPGLSSHGATPGLNLHPPAEARRSTALVERRDVTGQPFPRVDPALLFADLLDPSDASVRPAFESAAFDGFPIPTTSFP